MRRYLLLLLMMLALPTLRAENLVDVAQRAGSFKTFLAAVETAGLSEQLKTKGPYTIFMPTDTAFRQLDSARWEALQQDREALASLVRYHLIPGSVKVTEVKPGQTRSAAGPPLTLTSDNGMVTVNGSRVTESDLTADNGIIHGIDGVLTPPD